MVYVIYAIGIFAQFFVSFSQILSPAVKFITNWMVRLALFATLSQVVGDKNSLILVPSGLVGNAF